MAQKSIAIRMSWSMFVCTVLRAEYYSVRRRQKEKAEYMEMDRIEQRIIPKA
jgi:hypothetical protein